MTGVSAELLITVAVLILAAVATGTLAGRLFLAASRARPRPEQGKSSDRV